MKLTQRLLARKYFPDPNNVMSGSFTVAVQDGPASGQTVPHVHVHVIPRIEDDIPGEPDAIYEKMASEDGNVGGALWDRQRPSPGGGMPRIEDADRSARTDAEMYKEARGYEKMLKEMGA